MARVERCRGGLRVIHERGTRTEATIALEQEGLRVAWSSLREVPFCAPQISRHVTVTDLDAVTPYQTETSLVHAEIATLGGPLEAVREASHMLGNVFSLRAEVAAVTLLRQREPVAPRSFAWLGKHGSRIVLDAETFDQLDRRLGSDGIGEATGLHGVHLAHARTRGADSPFVWAGVSILWERSDPPLRVSRWKGPVENASVDPSSGTALSIAADETGNLFVVMVGATLIEVVGAYHHVSWSNLLGA